MNSSAGRLQEGILRRASDDNLRSALEGSNGLLELSGFRREVFVLFLPQICRCLLFGLVRRNVFGQKLNLGRQRRDLALQLQDCLAQSAQVVLSLLNGLTLALRRLLAPASILVVDLLLDLSIILHLGLQIF